MGNDNRCDYQTDAMYCGSYRNHTGAHILYSRLISNVPMKPRTYTEAEVREIVAKALNDAARETHGYCDATELMKWFDDKLADIRSGKENLE